MATFAPGTDVRDKHLAPYPRQGKIQGAVIHITLMFDGVDFVSNWNDRSNYPTYHISQSGKKTGITHPDRRPYTTAHPVDDVAVTFECDVSKMNDPEWSVNMETINSVIDVCEHHMRQEGYTRAARNIPGVDQKEFFIAGHRQYKQVGCPGNYMWNTGFEYIINELNRRLAGGAPSKIEDSNTEQDDDMKLNLFRLKDTKDYYAINPLTGDWVKMNEAYANLNIARGTCTKPIEVGMNEIDYFCHLGRSLNKTSTPSKEAAGKFGDSATKYHTVAKGDTFYGIANKYGVSVDSLTKLNPGLKANALEIGTKVRYK